MIIMFVYKRTEVRTGTAYPCGLPSVIIISRI